MEKDSVIKEKKAPKSQKTAPKTDSSKIYELSFILLPNLTEEKVAEEMSLISKLISSAEGDVISSENPVLIDLAYPMLKIISTTRHKVDQGYFGWIKFEMEPEKVLSVKQAIDAKDNIVRFMIIKTVRENTLLNGKMMFRKEDKTKKTDDGTVDEVLPDINPEELDKSIDDLVIA